MNHSHDTNIAIWGIIATVLSPFLVEFIKYLIHKKEAISGTLTGEWRQEIPRIEENGQEIEPKKYDKVRCIQRGEEVWADIERLVPSDPKRKWKFHGRFRENTLFGIFWSIKSTDPSFGTMFLRCDAKGENFHGSYTRLRRKTIQKYKEEMSSGKPIEVNWRRVNSKVGC